MMRELTIYRLYFTDADCYKKGVKQAPRGVQVHSTGANNPYLRRYVQPDDGRLGVNPNENSHNRPGGSVCASAYIGKLADGTVAVYQTLPWNYRCWLSGSGAYGNANKLGYIGFEICEDGCEDKAYFRDAVLDKAVLLAAYLCHLAGADPWTEITETPKGRAYAVMDHAELHRAGLASAHGDIGLWLKKFGYTFEDFRNRVRDAMEDGLSVTVVDAKEEPMANHPTLRRGDSGTAAEELQRDLSLLGYLSIDNVDGSFGPITEGAVRRFQRENGLTVDGVCGPKTWAALDAETGHDRDGAEPDTPLPDPPADQDAPENASHPDGQAAGEDGDTPIGISADIRNLDEMRDYFIICAANAAEGGEAQARFQRWLATLEALRWTLGGSGAVSMPDIAKSDWNAIRAATAILHQAVRKYENDTESVG